MTSFGEIRSAAGTQSIDAFEEALVATLPPIYNKEDQDTLIRKLYTSLAEELQRVDILLETVKHNNFLSVPVIEELQVRGDSDSDRLKNENAFQLDKIRVTPANSLVFQNAVLQEGDNEVQLLFIPEDIDFLISDANDPNGVPLPFPTNFNSETNTLTIGSTRSGAFTIRYKDSGNVLRFNENVEVPEGLFRLGYSEGGYSELGYGE